MYKKNYDCGIGYYALEVGEIIKEGDECFATGGASLWRQVNAVSIGKTITDAHYQIRRKRVIDKNEVEQLIKTLEL